MSMVEHMSLWYGRVSFGCMPKSWVRFVLFLFMHVCVCVTVYTCICMCTCICGYMLDPLGLELKLFMIPGIGAGI